MYLSAPCDSKLQEKNTTKEIIIDLNLKRQQNDAKIPICIACTKEKKSKCAFYTYIRSYSLYEHVVNSVLCALLCNPHILAWRIVQTLLKLAPLTRKPKILPGATAHNSAFRSPWQRNVTRVTDFTSDLQCTVMFTLPALTCIQAVRSFQPPCTKQQLAVCRF